MNDAERIEQALKDAISSYFTEHRELLSSEKLEEKDNANTEEVSKTMDELWSSIGDDLRKKGSTVDDIERAIKEVRTYK